ncbi:hypothetical protein DFH09DRAFT_1281037 [Mycena vulgaris]|nr:hypothetical protein DFH09DRAFT_1281037 [Mycena vulgaris]
MSTLMKGCRAGLEQAVEVFKVQGIDHLNGVTAMQEYGQKTHQDVLDLITLLSDEESSDVASSISKVFSTSQNSSSSLSLLPSAPKIFYGREFEVTAIVQAFGQGTPRIAILGAGGMGKTSLARAVLHHPDISRRYSQHCVFMTCDAASSGVQLAALIAAHIGLKPGSNLTQEILDHFASSAPSLLILDNLETIWEPRESRGDTERLLSFLTGMDHLALMVCVAFNRELAQKPHEPHAAFGHCAKLQGFCRVPSMFL